MMSFNVLTSIAANDAISSASSFGTPIRVKILIGAFVVVIMLVGAWLAVLQQMRHQKWAESRGLHYIKADVNLGKAIRHVFGLTRRRHVARDVIVIPAATRTTLYYKVTWVERHGKDEEKKRCTFSRYSLPGPLPRTHIRPEELSDLTSSDIDTEWQVFNKEFDVKSEDEQATHTLLTGPMQEFLMARMRRMHVEVAGGEAFLCLSNYKSEDSIAYASLIDEQLTKVPGFFFGRRQRRLGAFRRSDEPPPGSLPCICIKSRRPLR